MTLQTMSFIFGALLLAVGLLGGGFEVKEVKVSNVTQTTRVLAGLAGLVFIVLGFIQPKDLPNLAQLLSSSTAAPGIPDKDQWRSQNFPAPNAGLLAYTFIGGNPACASYDAHDCLWGVSIDSIDFARVKPLVCGAGHQQVYGETGFDNPKHWCNLAGR